LIYHPSGVMEAIEAVPAVLNECRHPLEHLLHAGRARAAAHSLRKVSAAVELDLEQIHDFWFV
jgi:hypothetical protein